LPDDRARHGAVVCRRSAGRQRRLSLGETLLLGFLGGLLGDVLSYALGRHFHQNIRRLPAHHPEWMAGAETYFQRYGIASLLVGRFIGPLRPMLPMVAGMCDMPLPRFIPSACWRRGLVGRLPAAGLGHRRGDPLAAAGRLLAAGGHRRRQHRSHGGPEHPRSSRQPKATC
jgi:hypothetical protein